MISSSTCTAVMVSRRAAGSWDDQGGRRRCAGTGRRWGDRLHRGSSRVLNSRQESCPCSASQGRRAAEALPGGWPPSTRSAGRSSLVRVAAASRLAPALPPAADRGAADEAEAGARCRRKRLFEAAAAGSDAGSSWRRRPGPPCAGRDCGRLADWRSTTGQGCPSHRVRARACPRFAVRRSWAPAHSSPQASLGQHQQEEQCRPRK